jgi:hypothetical protein
MKLDYVIEKKMESLLMNRGYVLDFSDNTMQIFVARSVDIDIYEEKFSSNGTSKANRLRYLWYNYPKKVVAKLNIDLLVYWENEKHENRQDHSIADLVIYKECLIYHRNLLDSDEEMSGEEILKNLKIEILSHKFIMENIEKTNSKIKNKDYSGAITNARSLVEHVLMELASRFEYEIKNKGDLLKLYNEVAKTMNLQAVNYDIDGFKQILSGLNSIINGISNLRNELSDAHARKYEPTKHHARIAINSAHTICEFLLDSYEHQKKIKVKTAKMNLTAS